MPHVCNSVSAQQIHDQNNQKHLRRGLNVLEREQTAKRENRAKVLKIINYGKTTELHKCNEAILTNHEPNCDPAVPPPEGVDVREDLGGVEEDVLLAAGGNVGVVARPALPDPGHVGVHHPRPPWGRGGGLGWAREGHLGAGYCKSERLFCVLLEKRNHPMNSVQLSVQEIGTSFP